MNKFFTVPQNIGGDTAIIDNREDLHHMQKALRLKVGDKVEVSDSSEWDYVCVIEEFDEDRALLKITDKQKFAREPSVKISLYQGVPKLTKMDFVIQKAVELGVSAIIPVLTERTVVTEKGNFAKKSVRWQKISDEAAKQCRRGRLPAVRSVVSFGEMIEGLREDYDLVLFLYENEDDYTIKQELQRFNGSFNSRIKRDPEIAVIVGPEGGFSEGEAKEIMSLGVRSASLGRTILRTETAGMAALAMIMYELQL